MIGTVPQPVPTAGRSPVNRAALAAARAPAALAGLADCHWCAHHCGVNRLAGEIGICGAGAEPRFFSAQVEVADELALIPTFAVALSGCDLRCDFCVTGAASWNSRAGQGLAGAAMAANARAALQSGARTIMVLGGEPTIHLPAVLAWVAQLPSEAPLIWKTNAHGSVQARDLLDGLFDYWLADFKFGNDACAWRLSHTTDYLRVVQDNLRWAHGHSHLIVRHLLMPGHVACCWRPIAEWLAANLPGVEVSLRHAFWPAWRAHRHPELGLPLSAAEARQAGEIAHACGLHLIP
jgi:putative pyruvate formate lyase activating enzyme